MRNIKLEIEYDGTNYCGWQTQSRNFLKPSIQKTVENALQKILKEKVSLIGSGRTDAGVHALCQVANFLTHSKIKPDKLHQALNAILPSDISVKKASLVRNDFHSRFNAKSKTYRYIILSRPFRKPFCLNYAYFFPCPLDVKLMRKESLVLLGRHNFQAFCASAGLSRNPIKTIKRIRITRSRDCFIHIDIEADGFLYNMARNIAGTLIEIGRGYFKKGRLKKILASKNRRLAGPTVAAKGLFLLKVAYDDD